MKNMSQMLISKLHNMIKSMPINNLGNLTIKDFMSWLDIDLREAEELADELYGERVLAYKYRYKCECGEICTVYEEKMLRDGGTVCAVCGSEYKADEIKIKAKRIFDINKEDLQELNEEANLGSKSKHVPILLSSKEGVEKKMEVFIGSSSEAKNYMDDIAVMIEELNHKPLLWSDSGKGIFCPGENTIDAIIAISQRVDAAVFVFNADDKLWNEKSNVASADSLSVVRDNVLFEYGLFMGKLGKTKVCIICKGKPKIASDLSGITYVDGDKGERFVKSKLKDWLENMSSKQKSQYLEIH